ncbi:MAG: type II toxin-antitoxin system VapC family toxin [Proteobacteria bacterium]|nr:type II toxin-antitoxin system VapC family toxin [Pseudomonadota bacterium]
MILLDTCVISEVARPAPDPSVLAWFSSLADEELWLSVISIGEIEKGKNLLEPGPRREQIHSWLEGLVESFADRILIIDDQVARRWGAISALSQRAGRPRPPIDTLLAATALQHGLVLATRNVADFEGTGVNLVNPWDL